MNVYHYGKNQDHKPGVVHIGKVNFGLAHSLEEAQRKAEEHGEPGKGEWYYVEDHTFGSPVRAWKMPVLGEWEQVEDGVV